MSFVRRWFPSVLVFAALAGLATSAWAQAEPDERTQRADPPPRQDVPPRNATSLSDAVRRVQRETGGQILGAERVQYDGRDINRVKVMDDRGRVRYMDDDDVPQRARDRDRDAGPRDMFDRRREGPRRDDAQPRSRGERPPRS